MINGNADSYNVTKVEGDLTIEGAAPTPGPAPGPTPGPTPAPKA